MQNPNDPYDPNAPKSSCCASFDERVRENPTRAIIAALGVGIAAALILRALSPPAPPRNQVAKLLEDIQERLHELADPALSRLNELAGESSSALKKGACRVEGLREQLRSLGDKVGSLFH